MKDIVERLRTLSRIFGSVIGITAAQITAAEAADEIERLRAEREADKALMRQALRVLNASIDVPAYGGHPAEEAVAAALRERLGEK